MLGISNPLGRPIGGAAALFDTMKVLPEIAENTTAMAKIEATMPVLVEVESTLERLRLAMEPLQDVGRLVRRIPGGRNEQ